MVIRPECVLEEHLTSLDLLREDGAMNMYGAFLYLEELWPELTKQEARAILAYWMQTFATRHPRSLKEQEGSQA